MKSSKTIIVVALIIAVTFFVYFKIKTNSKSKLSEAKQKLAEKKARFTSVIALNQMEQNKIRQKHFEAMQDKQFKFVRGIK